VDRAATPTLTAGDVLTLDEIRQLRRTSTRRGTGLVVHVWATIGAAIALHVLWPSAFTFVVAFAVVGSRQLGLMVVMHEAAHWLLLPRAAVNTWVGSWLCAHPMWVHLPAYRRRHHLHHRHTMTGDDPDLLLATSYPVRRAAFRGDIVRDLGGWTAAVMVLARLRTLPSGWRELRGPLASNAVLLGALAAVGQWHLYLLLWLLPQATWYQLVARLRTIAEHASVGDPADPLRNTRTTRAGVLARLFLAPYWVNYHLEHHLLVFVPCWKLPRAHALLQAKGYAARMELSSGYLDVVRRAAR
jgi:fatty acid desaturase